MQNYYYVLLANQPISMHERMLVAEIISKQGHTITAIFSSLEQLTALIDKLEDNYLTYHIISQDSRICLDINAITDINERNKT